MAEPQPPIIHRATIQPEWIDRNGHFNAGYYMVVFDDAIGRWLDYCGLTTDHRQARGVTTFSVESHTVYLRELHQGDEVEINGQLLESTDRKIHTFLRMFRSRDGDLAATNEVLTLHIHLATRRPGPVHAGIQSRLAEIRRAQAHLGRPPQAGRAVSIHAKRPATG